MAKAKTLPRSLVTLIGLGLLLLMAVACGTQAASPTPLSSSLGGGGPEVNSTVKQTGLPGYVTNGSASGSAPAARADYGASVAGSGQAQVYPITPQPGMNTGIWVMGRGEVTAEPDLAVLELGIEATRDTVAAARSDAAAAMDRILKVLKARGIADKDIHTTRFSIQPQYTSRDITRCPDGPEPLPTTSGDTKPQPAPDVIKCYQQYEQVITGYQVTNQLTVNVRDLDAVGEVVDKVAEAGGDLTRFHGVNFTFEDAEGLQTKARAAAVEDLMAKANQFATLTGSKLGKLIYITEIGSDFQKVEPFARAAQESGAPAPATPIMPGELEVVITVQAVFDIE
jgi:uncharacterized protein YggE